jgi:hypothetical protein
MNRFFVSQSLSWSTCKINKFVQFPTGVRKFSLLHRIQKGTTTTKPSLQWIPGLFPVSSWAQRPSVKLTPLLQLVSMLSMRGSVFLFSHTSEWRGAKLLKHIADVTLLFSLLSLIRKNERSFMRSTCCLSVYLLPLTFARKLMRSSCCLCLSP